jgi:hypothetical protein
VYSHLHSLSGSTFHATRSTDDRLFPKCFEDNDRKLRMLKLQLPTTSPADALAQAVDASMTGFIDPSVAANPAKPTSNAVKTRKKLAKQATIRLPLLLLMKLRTTSYVGNVLRNSAIIKRPLNLPYGTGAVSLRLVSIAECRSVQTAEFDPFP